jgi:hypothetical protein
VEKFIGHFIFLVGMMVFVIFGEPLNPFNNITWREILSMCAIPWLTGYTCYHIGWMNGYGEGLVKYK